MKIKAKIAIREREQPEAEAIALSLMPDNMTNMRTTVEGRTFVTHFDADKISSLMMSIDDYLINAKVAKEVIELLRRT